MTLKAKLREITGKKVKHLRNEGKTPASIFGPKVEAKNIEFNAKDFLKLFDKVGYSKFFDLELEGNDKKMKVLVKDINFHPTKDFVIDASLYAIDEDRKINVEVPIVLTGESPAIKNNLGFLVQQMDTLRVYCFPKDLPDHFEVSIETLENTGDAISIEDGIKLPEDVELDSSVDETSAVVYIAAAQKEIVEETPVEAEGEGEEGTEGAESTEGSESAESTEEAKE